MSIVPCISVHNYERRLDFRLEEYEFEILEEYCKTVGRTKSDVIRELVRGLKRKIKIDST